MTGAYCRSRNNIGSIPSEEGNTSGLEEVILPSPTNVIREILAGPKLEELTKLRHWHMAINLIG
jgi:hypothetical protein